MRSPHFRPVRFLGLPSASGRYRTLGVRWVVGGALAGGNLGKPSSSAGRGGGFIETTRWNYDKAHLLGAIALPSPCARQLPWGPVSFRSVPFTWGAVGLRGFPRMEAIREKHHRYGFGRFIDAFGGTESLGRIFAASGRDARRVLASGRLRILYERSDTIRHVGNRLGRPVNFLAEGEIPYRIAPPGIGPLKVRSIAPRTSSHCRRSPSGLRSVRLLWGPPSKWTGARACAPIYLYSP